MSDALRIVSCGALLAALAHGGATPVAQPVAQPFRAAQAVAQPAGAAGYVETIPGTAVRFEMMPIPEGRFSMGSPPDEPGRGADEGPQHPVELHPFWMGKTEVTWDAYDPFAFGRDLEPPRQALAPRAPADLAADAVTRPTPPYGDESFGYGKGRQPVINVTWHAAMEYCRWLSARTGKTYRLPTEAEWEYAARAGTTTAYSFGDRRALDAHGWHHDNSGERPHPVGAKAPNPWGLHDMHGNVAEWGLDQYDAGFYARVAAGAIGPVLLPSDRRYPHVARGGSWDDGAARLRSAARRGSTAGWSRRDPQSPQSIWWHTDAAFAGFRVVRAVDEQENLKGIRSKITKNSQ
jgi:formylglycine-generating enzyme required for sulfatase activity